MLKELLAAMLAADAGVSLTVTHGKAFPALLPREGGRRASNGDHTKKGHRHEHHQAGSKLARMAVERRITVRH